MECLVPLLVPFVIILPSSLAQPAINSVMGMPDVYCEMDKLKVVARTARPFWGRIFAKGRSADPDCAKHFQVGGSSYPELEIKLAACGMLRERKLDPKPGLLESIVIVISFHSMLLTKKDRAYSVQCYYEQQHLQRVDGAVTVMEMSTIPLGMIHTQSARCHYSVHHHGIEGPEARVAEIGQKLYHQWTCEGPSDLKMLVKSCTVSNGQDEQFDVVDEIGCAVDPTILPDLTYMTASNSLPADDRAKIKAYVAADAFKFSDNSQMQFSCTIQLCSETRGDAYCDDMGPPVCYDRSIGAIVDKHNREEPVPPQQRPPRPRHTEPPPVQQSRRATPPSPRQIPAFNPADQQPQPQITPPPFFGRDNQRRQQQAVNQPPTAQPPPNGLDIERILQLHEQATNLATDNKGQVDPMARDALFSGLVIDTNLWTLHDDNDDDDVGRQPRQNTSPPQNQPWQPEISPFVFRNAVQVPSPQAQNPAQAGSAGQPLQDTPIQAYYYGRRTLHHPPGHQSDDDSASPDPEPSPESTPEQSSDQEQETSGRVERTPDRIPDPADRVEEAPSRVLRRVKRYFDEVDVHAGLLNVLDPQTTSRATGDNTRHTQSPSIEPLPLPTAVAVAVECPTTATDNDGQRQLLRYTSSSVCVSQWWFGVCVCLLLSLVIALMLTSSTLLIRQSHLADRINKPHKTFFDVLISHNRRRAAAS